jgi:hypothetical protein
MKSIAIEDLKVGETCLFQLSTWAPVNLHFVRILYVGTKYIVMHNIERDEEYCVSRCPYDIIETARTPNFYVSEEL